MICLLLSLQINSFAQAPFNDRCSGAFLISTVSSGWSNTVAGNVANATESFRPNPNCDNTTPDIARDVWFKFTALTTSVRVEVSPSAELDPGVEIFNSPCPTATSPYIRCVDRAGGRGSTELFPLTGLVVNQIYYIRVYHYTTGGLIPNTTTFDIRIQSIAATATVPSLTAQTGATGCIIVDWDPIASATDYELFRDNVSLGRFTATEKNDCNLTAGSNHCYKVRACTGAQCSAFSTPDCADAGTATLATYTVTVTAQPTTGGRIVSGNGSYDEGTQVTVVAAAHTGYEFDGWYEGTQRVSQNLSYSFTITENKQLEARFIVTYTVNSFDAAPWQRSEDGYPVDFKVTTGDGSQFYLYWTLNGNEQSIGPFNSGQAYYIRDITAPSEGTVAYAFGIGSDNYRKAVPSSFAYRTTAIIEKKWTNKEIIIDNNDIQPIKIPIKYYKNTNIGTIIQRDELSSDYSNYPNPTGSHSVDGRYFIINNPATLKPSALNYRIRYFRPNFNEEESGIIIVAKIRQLNNDHMGAVNNAKPVIVFLGGLRTDMYDVLESYAGGSTVAIDAAWSISKYFTQRAFNVWYLSVPNDDYIQKNAYLLKIGLEAIKTKTQSNNINIICHSKVRLLTG